MNATTRLDILHHFAAVEDPRDSRFVTHRLGDILTIALCGILSGAKSFEDLAAFSRRDLTLVKAERSRPGPSPCQIPLTHPPSKSLLVASALRCTLQGRDFLEKHVMEPERFERSLLSFVRRRPFESFQIRFVDGEAIPIDHPEAVVFRGGVGVYISAKGEPTLFDHRSVRTLNNAPDVASA